MIVPKMQVSTARRTKQRLIENIWREAERKKAELPGAITPSMFRNPKFYFALMLVLTFIGFALFNATDHAVKRRKYSPELRTLRNLDVLAEGLGRYRFHVGRYPNARNGLGALVRDPGAKVALKWNGPYISLLCNDAWGTPFVYIPPKQEDQLPTLFSCGADRLPNTADDLKPDTARFDPGTEWTNGWLSAQERLPGVTILNP